MSFVLLQQIAVLFLIMAMGSCLIFFHLLKVEDSKIISVICIYVIIPCVILKAYQIEYTPQIRDGFILSFMVSFAAQELVISLERICLFLLLFLLLWEADQRKHGYTLY